MRIAVLGMGKIGHNTAALLTKRGHDVVAYTRDARKAEDINRFGITVHGAYDGNFPVHATTELSEAVKDSRVLVVTTTSSGHKPMAKALSSLLEPRQVIVIMTGNWGALEMYQVLRAEVREKQVVIGETSGNLSGTPTLKSPATVEVKPYKSRMSFAAIPAARTEETTAFLKDVFPEFYPAGNVLETSLNSTNPPVHVPVALFNITRMANGEDTAFYGEALPELLQEFLMKTDEERLAVAAALGLKPKGIMELMNGAWGSDYKDLKTMGLENVSLRRVRLPKTPFHRFLTEDVPYGFVPLSRLGKMYGVPTPRIDLQIEAFRYLVNKGEPFESPELDPELLKEVF